MDFLCVYFAGFPWVFWICGFIIFIKYILIIILQQSLPPFSGTLIILILDYLILPCILFSLCFCLDEFYNSVIMLTVIFFLLQYLICYDSIKRLFISDIVICISRSSWWFFYFLLFFSLISFMSCFKFLSTFKWFFPGYTSHLFSLNSQLFSLNQAD